MKERALNWWRIGPLLLALAILLPPHPIHAQEIAGPSLDEIGTVYLGNSQVLAASHPRLLTKNAHVVQFVCAPTGTRVAYIGEIAGLSGLHVRLGIVTTQSGDETTYLRVDTPIENGHMGSVTLIQGLDGWSDDAAYLAFETNTFDSASNAPTDIDQLECVDLVHNTVVPVPLPFDQLPHAADGSPATLLFENLEGAAWSPGQRLLAFGAYARLDGGGQAACLFLFDADHRATRLLFALDKGNFRFDGWVDATHLAYRAEGTEYVYDLATGKSAAVPATPRLARGAIAPWSPLPSTTKLQMLDKESLSLTEGSNSVADPAGNKADVISVWITRTGGPAKPSALSLDAFPQAGPQGGAQFLPNGGFDRQDRFHVVYVSGGDLKVVDLSPRAATPSEKLANGEKLTCAEETPIAESDARQVGLGILQWVQDNNETFPPSDGFHDSVYPYIKSDAVFTSPNGVPFHYLAPADPKLADMERPADTPLGEFDLACEKVVLYADGHVKLEQKGPAGP